MAGCAAFVLPSKPRPEFVETFGIALVEKMLAGGGPVITTDTGGIGEAVGDCALIVPVDVPVGDRRGARPGPAMSADGARRWQHRARDARPAVRPGARARPAAGPGGQGGHPRARRARWPSRRDWPCGEHAGTGRTPLRARIEEAQPARCCSGCTRCRSRSCRWSPSS